MVKKMKKINYIKINTKNMLANIEYIKTYHHYSYYILDVSNNAFSHGMYLIKYLHELIDYLYVNTFLDLQLIRKYDPNIPVIYNGEITEDNVFDLIIHNAIIVVYDIDTLKMIHSLNIKDSLNFIFYVDPTGYYGISSKQDILDYLNWDHKYLNLFGIMAYLDEKNYDDFKYIIRPIQNGQLMILNHEEDKRKNNSNNCGGAVSGRDGGGIFRNGGGGSGISACAVRTVAAECVHGVLRGESGGADRNRGGDIRVRKVLLCGVLSARDSAGCGGVCVPQENGV